MTLRFPLALLCAAIFSRSAAGAAQDLVVQVVRGAGANNNVVSGEMTPPIVRVVNVAGSPVSGALVVFTAPAAGPSVEFSGTGISAQGLSDESGTVAAPRIKPTGGDGQVEIRVLAAKDGKSANVFISQMNLGLENSETQEPLEIAMIPVLENPPSAKSGGRRRLRFRVETGSGKPVVGALVTLTTEALKGAGKAEEIASLQETSAADGTVLIIVEHNAGRVPIEITVKASLSGRSTTRYFILPN